MEQWNYTWEDSRKFEHPLSIQEYEFRLGMYDGTMVPQPYLQDQYFGSRLSFIEEMTAYLQKSAVDDDERWRESLERSAKIDQLIKQIQANRLFEHDQELTNQQPCEFFNPNPLVVHHDLTLKEDGNREEELVLPGIGLEDCDIVQLRSNKGVDKEAGGEENVPSGMQTLNQKCESALERRLTAAGKKKKKKKKGLKTEVFDIFNKVDVNLPLLNRIGQVPVYAEFVRDLCLHKRKFHDDEKFVLKEEVSAIIQRRVSPNMNDPTSFVISCTIGEKSFDGALMDIGTNINIMPLATFRKLEISPLKPTSISVQLADGTFRMPVGIVEDVLVRVNKFILPADFVILDMDEDPKTESRLPIILGCPFMAIAGAKIIKLQVLQPTFPQNVINDVLSKDLVKGNQAKSEKIFGHLEPPKPLIQNHHLPVITEQLQQESSSMGDYFDEFDAIFGEVYEPDDKDFAIPASESKPDSSIASLSAHKTEVLSACVPPSLDMDPHFTDPQTSSFRQVHKLDEFISPPKHEVVQPTPTIHERDRGILPTPYVPPHRRRFTPTPYCHPHGYRFPSTHPNLESFESFKMRSPPCSEVQLEAIQCLREILGIGENRMKVHEWYPSPLSDCKSMATSYMNYLGGRQMCYAPP
ncbi:hypothetical protein M0R45_001683 [Rubus argutus]|uniref:Aspartic peptidase DDI1-type domain-containing protein n=1 Tax=Rubus argutus TaxID=59490 RepID=A0AAW1VLT4_RUBAR